MWNSISGLVLDSISGLRSLVMGPSKAPTKITKPDNTKLKQIKQIKANRTKPNLPLLCSLLLTTTVASFKVALILGS